MIDIIKRIRQELRYNTDEGTRRNSQRFFKEEIKFYGVKTPIVNQIGRRIFPEIKGYSKAEIFALCEELWKSGYIEESFIACNWSYALHRQYEESDFETFERWVYEYVNNWVSCDILCNQTIGEFVKIYPDYLSCLREWAVSDNYWVRRAATATLIVPARKGLFLDDIFQIATILLHDEEDLVQKGYGLLLKAASETKRIEVFNFVMKHKATMPRMALRYAIEKMPTEMRAVAMRREI